MSDKNEPLSPEEGQDLVAKLRKLALSPDDVPLGTRISAGILSLLLNHPKEKEKDSLTAVGTHEGTKT